MAKGDIRQCLKELEESKLDEGWKLKQIRSLLRFFQEVGGLVEHIKGESGFAGDSTSYLEILCAKEEADLIRRVSHTRVLRQVRAWRRGVGEACTAAGCCWCATQLRGCVHYVRSPAACLFAHGGLLSLYE